MDKCYSSDLTEVTIGNQHQQENRRTVNSNRPIDKPGQSKIWHDNTSDSIIHTFQRKSELIYPEQNIIVLRTAHRLCLKAIR